MAVLAEAPEAPEPDRPRLLSRRPSRQAGAVGAFVLLAAALRIPQLGRQSFWYDESFTYHLVHQSFGGMLSTLPRTELTPPLYYTLAWLWSKPFGDSEAALRALSVLAGVLTVPVLYLAVRRLISARAGLIAAALVACNPLLIWYSREARSYALLVLLASLSLLAFANLLRPRPPARAVVLWGIAAALTGATHYYATLLLVPEAVWLLWRHRWDWRVWLTVVLAGAADLALLPLALSQQPNASWIALWRLDRRMAQIPTQFLLGTGAPDRIVLKVIGAVAIAAALLLLVLRADSTERRGALMGGALALIGLAIALVLVGFGIDELITRNVIVVLIGLIVLFAGALGARRAGWVGPGIAAVLCAIGVLCAVAVMHNPVFQRPDWRGLAHALVLTARPRPGTAAHPTRRGRARIIIIERYFASQPLDVYLPGLRLLRSPDEILTHEVDLVAVQSPRPAWFCWWGSECNLKRARVYGDIRVAGFRHSHHLIHVGQFLVLRLVSHRARWVTRSEIYDAMLPSGLDGWAMLVQPKLS